MYALITQRRENQIFRFWSQNFWIDFPCRIWSLNVSFYSWLDCFIKFCKPMIFKSHFWLRKFRTQKVEKIRQILTVCTANLCNQSATVVQLIVAITATFSFCNFWWQSLQIIGCKVKVHLLDANISSITWCT